MSLRFSSRAPHLIDIILSCPDNCLFTMKLQAQIPGETVIHP